MTKKDLTQQDLEGYRKHNLGQSLMEVARHFQKQALQGFSDEGYDGIQVGHQAILTHLSLSGTRLTELAKRSGITKQAMGQLVDEVERLGYVERVPDPLDGRAKIVRFTNKGRKLIQSGTRVGSSIQKQYTELTSENKMKKLNELLHELHSKIRESERN